MDEVGMVVGGGLELPAECGRAASEAWAQEGARDRGKPRSSGVGARGLGRAARDAGARRPGRGSIFPRAGSISSLVR